MMVDRVISKTIMT